MAGGFASFIVSKHAKIVSVLFPASVAGGFLYTVKHGSNPLMDLKSVVIGDAPSTNSGSLTSYQFKLGGSR
jgi:hypothetical protein